MSSENNEKNEQQYSLNDDRRVKTLSPGALVIRRFLRNRVAVTGLVILVFMFIFSFIGGMITPYKEDQLFYRYEYQNKQYAGAKENTELRYVEASKGSFPKVAQAKFVIARKTKKPKFEVKKSTYFVEPSGEDFYAIYEEKKGGKELVAFASYDIVTSAADEEASFELQFETSKALASGESSFTLDGKEYTVDESGIVSLDGESAAYSSRYIIQPIMKDVELSQGFKEQLLQAISEGITEFVYTDENGEVSCVHCTYDPLSKGGNSPDGRKVRGTVHWVSAGDCFEAEIRNYDRLFKAENPSDESQGDFEQNLNEESLQIIKGCLLEGSLKGIQPLDTFQFMRQGYYCVDKYSTPDHPVINRTVQLNSSWGKKK